MKQKLYSKEAKIHFYVCFLVLAVIVGIHLVNWITNDNTAPRNPETFKLEKPAVLRGTVNDKHYEVNVKKGQEVKILGARKGTMTIPERLWVELENGFRGYIYCTDFDLEYKAQLKDKKRLVPVKVNEYDGNNLICELKDGTSVKLYGDDVFPEWPNSWNVKYLSTDTYSSYISKDKFERKYIGSTLEKNDKRMVPARYVYKKGNKTYAFYPMYVLDTSDGMRYAPTVVYNESGEAESYINEESKKRAKFFLKLMPLVGPAVDVPFFNNMIQGSLYNQLPQGKGEASFIFKVIGLLISLIFLALALIWLYATPMIPVLLVAVLMHFPKILYPFSNRALYVFMLLLTIAGAYLWGALLVGWGIMWLFLLPLPLAVLIIHEFATSPVVGSAPSGRCLKCRNIETMEFVDSVYDHEYKEWSREKKYAKTLGVKVRRWQTWTQVTVRNAGGSTSSWRENVKDHEETTTTTLYDDFNVHYNVTVYKNNYTCCVCGQHEHNMSKSYEEIDRKHLGSHVETTVE